MKNIKNIVLVSLVSATLLMPVESYSYKRALAVASGLFGLVAGGAALGCYESLRAIQEIPSTADLLEVKLEKLNKDRNNAAFKKEIDTVLTRYAKILTREEEEELATFGIKEQWDLYMHPMSAFLKPEEANGLFEGMQDSLKNYKEETAKLRKEQEGVSRGAMLMSGTLALGSLGLAGWLWYTSSK